MVPESLSKENRRSFSLIKANPISAFYRINKYPSITGLIIGVFLLYLAGTSVQGIWAFYAKEKFKWDEKWIGYSLGVVGLSVALVQGGLIRVVVPRLGQRVAIYFGLTMYGIGLLAFALSGSTLIMFLSIVVYCMGGFAGPTLQSLMSGKVPANEQGELQGLLTSLQSLSTIIGPFFMLNLFSFFIGSSSPIYFPGAPFIAGAILVAGALLFTIWSLEKHHNEKEPAMKTAGGVEPNV